MLYIKKLLRSAYLERQSWHSVAYNLREFDYEYYSNQSAKSYKDMCEIGELANKLKIDLWYDEELEELGVSMFDLLSRK